MKKTLTILLCATMLGGCTLTPDYVRPNVETPATWSVESEPSNVSEAASWWKEFGSEELNGLMKQALAQNTNLLAGVQRIEQARASLKSAGASLMPNADGSAGASRSRTNPNTGKSSYASSLSAGLSVSYELDLFGANRASVTAAEANLQGSLYDQGALGLSLMGDVADNYFTLVNLRERLQIAEDNLKISKEVLDIIKARVKEGSESDLELSQQKSSVASSEAARISLEEQITNAENALAVLLGQVPQSLDVKRTSLGGITIPSIQAGQPSELLERRPDLRSSEADLLAANANIGAARAAFYPSISLGLSDSLSLAGFGDPSSTVFSLASSIATPIFSGGRLDGNLENATARQLELVQTYRGNVLTAFQEVEDALAGVRAATEREVQLREAMDQAQYAHKLSKARYDAGSIDFQTLLDTQKTRLSAEDSYAQARLARLSAAVTLYRTLGGGWKS